jgi:hypothetical protein
MGFRAQAQREELTVSGQTSAETPWLDEVRRRIGSVLQTVTGESGKPDGVPLFPLPEGPAPHWFLFPIWLDDAWVQEGAEPLPTRVLADVLWAQYALFLSIRIHDDLLDRERDDLRLLFVADRFLVESFEMLQRLDGLGSAFWNQYRQWLRESIEGILEVKRLEQEAGRFTEDDLRLHARVSAIFKVGSAAICHLHGRRKEIHWISQLMDGLAVFSQIGDDLQDLTPDVQSGRFTWPANILSGMEASGTMVADEFGRLLGGGFLKPERGEAIIARLRELVRTATTTLPEATPTPVRNLVCELESRVEALEQSIHETRVRWFFGKLLTESRQESKQNDSLIVNR